jgi:hypothetical protein
MSLRNQDLYGIDVPWLAKMGTDGKWHFAQAPAFAEWSTQTYAPGDEAMFIPVPLADDTFHEAAFRYLHGCVIPFIARHGLHEPNYERAWDQIAPQFLPLQYDGKGRKRKLTRKSTAMHRMSCAELCDLIDRIIAWASDPDELNLTIPFADRSWKWKLKQQQLQRSAGVDTSRSKGAHVPDRKGDRDGSCGSSAAPQDSSR